MANTDFAAKLLAAAGKDKNLANLLLAVMGGAGVVSGTAQKNRTKTKKGGGRSAGGQKAPGTTEERKAAFAVAVVAAAEKAGFTNNIPNETILTYGKWEERGFVPKKGSKAIRVKTAGMRGKGMPLFHRDQVEAVGSETTETTTELTQSPSVN